VCATACAAVRVLVCVEKYVNNPYEEKRGKDKYSSQLLPIVTCVGCFDDPTMKPYLIEHVIL